jgi:hypothetical protein
MDLKRIHQSEMICLTKVPKKYWNGLWVYHPMAQAGETPYWRTEDYPDWIRDEDDEPGFVYDEGEVISFDPPDQYGDIRVTFKTEWGRLRYGAYNLWVVKADFEHLTRKR